MFSRSQRICVSAVRFGDARRGLSFFSAIDHFFAPKLETESMSLFGGKSNQSEFKSIVAHSDSEYNGQSTSKVEFVKLGDEEVLNFSGKFNFQKDQVKNNVKAVKGSLNHFTSSFEYFGPYLNSILCFLGYCGLSTIFKKEKDLRDYRGIEIVLSSDKEQDFYFNFQNLSYSEQERYQISLKVLGDGEKYSVFVPFTSFYSTQGGKIRSFSVLLPTYEIKL